MGERFMSQQVKLSSHCRSVLINYNITESKQRQICGYNTLHIRQCPALIFDTGYGYYRVSCFSVFAHIRPQQEYGSKGRGSSCAHAHNKRQQIQSFSLAFQTPLVLNFHHRSNHVRRSSPQNNKSQMSYER